MSRTLIGGALPHKSSDLGHALARLRKNFYHLWQVLEELRSAPPQYSPPDALLREWRGALKPSQEWRKALFYEQAVDVLSYDVLFKNGIRVVRAPLTELEALTTVLGRATVQAKPTIYATE